MPERKTKEKKTEEKSGREKERETRRRIEKGKGGVIIREHRGYLKKG